jgi:hypothetical protein
VITPFLPWHWDWNAEAVRVMPAMVFPALAGWILPLSSWPQAEASRPARREGRKLGSSWGFLAD